MKEAIGHITVNFCLDSLHFDFVLSCIYVDTIYSPAIRFLLCNQAMLPPLTVPYRQHSSASQSSAVPMEEGEVPNEGEGVESVIDDEDRAKLSKVMSTEDEVARLTIEVRHMPQLCSSLALWCIALPCRL